MSVLITIGVVLAAFVLGVVFSEKVKVWVRVKSKDAIDTTERAVKSKL